MTTMNNTLLLTTIHKCMFNETMYICIYIGVHITCVDWSRYTKCPNIYIYIYIHIYIYLFIHYKHLYCALMGWVHCTKYRLGFIYI